MRPAYSAITDKVTRDCKKISSPLAKIPTRFALRLNPCMMLWCLKVMIEVTMKTILGLGALARLAHNHVASLRASAGSTNSKNDSAFRACLYMGRPHLLTKQQRGIMSRMCSPKSFKRMATSENKSLIWTKLAYSGKDAVRTFLFKNELKRPGFKAH